MKSINRFAQVTVGIALMLLVGISSSFAYSVKLTSTPKGAKVFINGVELQHRTPVIVTDLTENKKYNINLKKNGFEEYQTSLKTNENFDRIHADLTKAGLPYSQKTLNAKIDETNSTALQRGFGYDKMFKKGTYGWLYVTSNPNKATVFINNERQSGVTPNKFKVPTGLVKVSIVVPGKAKQDFSRVLIREGRTTVLDETDLRTNMIRPTTGMLFDNE